MKKLFLVDAYALIFRFYYAFLGRPMRNSDGLNTSAIFGFVKFMQEIIAKEHPHYLGVAFDPKGGNFRNQLYPEYKANRSETPEDIVASVPYIKKILEAMRIPVLEIPGYEADDVIGTLSAKAAKDGFEVYMVTPDKDFGQLVQDHVFIYKQRKSGDGVEIIGPAQIKENYCIDDPNLIIDILALWGDAADNIPGVPGVGEKSACKLVAEFGTVENILANTDKLKGKQKENIEATSEQLLLSKRLATIETDVPIDFRPDHLIMEEPDVESLSELYRELGFNMFLRNMGASYVAKSGEMTSNSADTESPVVAKAAAQTKPNPSLFGQGSLFGDDMQPASPETINTMGDLFADSGFESAATTEHTYTIIRGAVELLTVIEEMRKSGRFCFDTETTGFDIFNDRVVGMSFSTEAHKAYYLPVDKTNQSEYTQLLKPLFEDEQVEKVGQNIKFDIMVLANMGIEVKGFKYDTMILHYLLDPEARHNMNYLARTYLNYAPIEIELLIGRASKQITMDMVPADKVAEYAAEDADITWQLYEKLWPLVKEASLDKLYSEIEEPLIDVLADIEMAGVRLDTAILSESGGELNAKLADMESRIREYAGDPTLNVNSPKQLGDALFLKLNIDPKAKTTKTKQYKTDEETLQRYADHHPIVPLILEYRGVKKLLSTYVEALPLLVNSRTGRVHTSYNQAVTATGRLSSTNPNLQNIPIRDQMGREIRKAFVPRDKDYLLLSADYSQVELRLMAHLSEDPNLLEAFHKGEDIHTATASRVFHTPLSDVTSDMRRKAKTANFGIIYGISAFGLSQRLNIPITESKAIIDGYFESYPGVKAYMDNVIKQAHTDGYVTTIFGRKRYLADIGSGNANVRGLAERNAINAPIQGSAADIMKMAMIAAHKELKSRGLKSKIILQVHDELVVDMLRSEQEEVVKIVIDAMEGVAKLKVALTAEYGVGENWIEAH